MNTFVNYLIEANLGLVFFILIYWLFLEKENQFELKRGYLLSSIVFSLTFPLLHINLTVSKELIPSIGQVVPAYWLPEIIVNGSGLSRDTETVLSVWVLLEWIYLFVGLIFVVLFVFQLIAILRLFIRSKIYHWQNCLISESEENKPTFSFFKFIFIGQANKISQQEKQEILFHELVHAQKFHSLDVVVVNLLGILFWFNPIVRVYKKVLVQLHEFEADARSVKDKDVDVYCSLLAKVALQSTDFSLANHFNNSLTLKRIKMMKTMKRKIQNWKVAAIVVTIPLFFLLVACQDQIVQEISKSTVTQLGDYPPEVQAALTKLKVKYPDQTFTYIEGSREDMIRLNDKTDKFKFLRSSWVWKRNGQEINGAILSDVASHAEELKIDGEVFTVVEESATPQAGMNLFYEYIRKNLKYPESARKAGIQGKVFVEFIVNTDGTASDFKIIKGLGEGCDQEALRVMSGSPPWIPGKQRGISVKQRMVLPIVFSLGNDNSLGIQQAPQQETVEKN